MPKLAVVLKADPSIGTGHLMRINGILPNLKALNYHLYLVTDSLSPELENLCTLYEKIIRVPTLDEIPNALYNLQVEEVLFDHYYIDAKIESAVRDFAKVIIIDDLANRPHNCDLLFDQGLLRKASDYQALVNPDAKIFVGPSFSLTKKEFTRIKKPPNFGKSRILVNFGGADPLGALKISLESLIKINAQKYFDFTVLAGIANPLKDEIKKLTLNQKGFTYLTHSSDVPALFSSIDLALGAAGGMTFERIAASIPSICVSVADNQELGPLVIEQLGLGLALPFSDLKKPQVLLDKLFELQEKAPLIKAKCPQVIDGNGLLRIANKIFELLN